jgi:hypothetical protein
MRWKNRVSALNRSWTKAVEQEKKRLLHIPRCGYAGVFPQARKFPGHFCCLA